VQGFARAARILTADKCLHATTGSLAVANDQSAKDELRAFGQAVGELRAARGMSVSELATAARTTPRRIKRLEAGLADVRYDLLVALVDALNVKASQLIGRAEELEQETNAPDVDRQREQ
jgi:ribosome-binding protein aMBF1 (putative translation factor)